MTDLFILEFIAAVSVAAFVQGFTGLGFGIVTMAALAVFMQDVERASVLATMLVMLVNVAVIAVGLKHAPIDWRKAGLVLAGYAVAMPLGYAFVSTFHDGPLVRWVLGLVLLAFALNGFLRPHIRRRLRLWAASAAGFFGGLLGGAFSTGGPPIAMYLYSQEEQPAQAKSTLQVVFLAGAVWRTVYIAAWGRGIAFEQLKMVALAVPAVVLFTGLGHLSSRRVASGVFLRAVYAVIGAAGVFNILKGIRASF
jgi:uncharacterized membrane protein YfcA